MAVVYSHRRNDTNEIFYIGIGSKKKRAYSKRSRNKHWHNIVKKAGYTVEFFIIDIPYSTTKEIEKGLIALYGRRDKGLGPLCNMTAGGDGSIGSIVSSETRVKMSISGRGKIISKEARYKSSISQKGRKLKTKHIANISKAGRKFNYLMCNKITSEVLNVFQTTKEASDFSGDGANAICRAIIGKTKKNRCTYLWKREYK